MFLHDFGMGGAQRMTLTIAGSLARAGYGVDLVVVSDAGPLRQYVTPDVGVIALRPPHSPFRWLPRRHGVRAAIPALAAYIRERAPDVIFGGANHVSLALAMAHRLAEPSKTRLMLRATNPLQREGGSWLKQRFARCLLPRADAIIAVSVPIANDHEAALRGRGDVRVIPEPALDAAFERRLAAAPFHPWLTSDTPLVVTIGRLVHQKDHVSLLMAFAQVARVHPTARLLIIGDGPLRRRLEMQVRMLGLADRVAFAGEIRNPLPALRFARCFALPSRWEGLGIVAIEAAAAGCRIVATDTPAVRWALDDGAIGDLVAPDDRSAMARAILAALSTDARPVDAAGREHLESFREATVTACYVGLIEELCSRPGSP